MDVRRLRNIGVVAHIDAGKTTVSERILFVSGVEHRIGEVDAGTAVMDWMPEERERGITITAAATHLSWRDHPINLIDTPGHVDFTIEVERCMRVLDGAVLVIDAVAGVQAQSEAVWKQMQRHHVPAVCFVNKCDRAGADFLAAVQSLERRLQAPAVPVQYPLLRDGSLVGVVDLLRRVACEFPPLERGVAAPVEVAVPAELADEVGVLRSELMDRLADRDEALMQAVLEEREVRPEDLRAALRRCTLARTLVPVLCGAALRNIGVQPLLDAVVDYLPSPLEVPPIRGRDPRDESPLERPCDPKGPIAALAFKLHADAHGDLTFVRVYSGSIRTGDQLYNPRVERVERVARVVRMHADARRPLEVAEAGQIVALTGLKWTGTGDTLCDRDAPVLLERLAFPLPVISMVVEPRSTADRDKLRVALERLAHEDPSFHAQEDEATGQWLISGMGELHLEVAMQRLRSEHGVEATMGAPRVSYREAVLGPGRGAARVDRVLGGKPLFAAVELEVAPLPEPGAGVEVVFDPACLLPHGFRAAVRDALVLGAQTGPRLGFPLVQARVRVLRCETRAGAEAEMAYTQAASNALREALEAARVDLLEPLMAFEIQTPPEFVSGVLADLNARRAEVEGVGVEGALREITGRVPLGRMFGYSTAVRSLSQGRAGFSMLPAGFRAVPDDELVERGLTWG